MSPLLRPVRPAAARQLGQVLLARVAVRFGQVLLARVNARFDQLLLARGNARFDRRRSSAWTCCLLLASLCAAWASTPPAHADRGSHKPARKVAPKIASAQPAIERAERLGLGLFKTAAKLLQGRPDEAWVSAVGAEGWNGTLRFPVPGGYVTRGFGSGKGGYHQAIDVASEAGSKVRAAAGGLVGYAGNQVSGYGNLVILIHPGGFVTMYAHNRKNLVLAGQRVRRNAVIAELGSTGRSMGPHVHFKLLWNGQNCDPAPLFRPAGLRKNGAAFAPLQSAWKQPHKKPKTLRCGARKHHPDYARKGGTPEPDVDADEDGTELTHGGEGPKP